MYTGMRVTDAVTFYRHRGEWRGSLHVVRMRRPDKLRWRAAVSSVTGVAATLHGKERMRVEEPVREIVLDLPDRELRREVVLDARRWGIDIDRGEIMPNLALGDLRRLSYLTSTDLSLVDRYVKLPDDFFAPIDTAGVAVVSRALATHFRDRASRVANALRKVGDFDHLTPQQRFLFEKAQNDADLGRRWGALSKALVADSK